MDENSADAQIRAALAQNDPAAVELIWDRYAGALLTFLAARLGSSDDAEDVLQALFVTIVRKRQILAEARCMAAYLYRMARNETATYVRSHQRHRRDAADTEPWLVPRESGDQPYDLAEQLQVTLSRLPLAQREVVVLKVYREKTFGEIAQVLGVSLNTAASRYRYGMERLRSLLKDNAS